MTTRHIKDRGITVGTLKVKRLLLAVALLAGPVIAGVAWFRSASDTKKDLAFSFGVVAAFIVIVLGLLEMASRGNPNSRRKGFGYLEIVLGADGRFSTSKAMVASWTLVFASALTFLSAMVWFSPMTPDQAFGQDWDAYFLLLGGPFAAAVLAKGITTSKAENGEKTSTAAASASAVTADPPTTSDTPKLGDLSRNDAGELSLPDTQYWVFSLVAIIYFVGAFVDVIMRYANVPVCPQAPDVECTAVAVLGLPEIPSALLGLTSLAALTYVGAKAVATEGVRLASMYPNPAPASAEVTISLVNVPEKVTQGQITIRFTKGPQMPFDKAPTTPPVRDGLLTKITVEAPQPTGEYEVVVVTPSGASGPGTLTVQ